MSDSDWQQIYVITDYHDGPLVGVADLRNKPHAFSRLFDDVKDEYSDNYRLSEISSERFDIEVKKHEIFMRWAYAFQRGEVSLDTHPALPSERQMLSVLEAVYPNDLQTIAMTGKTYSAEFGDVDLLNGNRYVRWRSIED